MPLNNYILLIHLCACLFLTGLIWVIQLVHYPSFEYIDHKKSNSHHLFHCRRITFIVGPAMLIELLSGILIVAQNNDMIFIINFIFLIGIWLCTALISVPTHNKLAEEYNLIYIKRLVTNNWYRTFLWTVRSAILMTSFVVIQNA